MWRISVPRITILLFLFCISFTLYGAETLNYQQGAYEYVRNAKKERDAVRNELKEFDLILSRRLSTKEARIFLERLRSDMPLRDVLVQDNVTLETPRIRVYLDYVNRVFTEGGAYIIYINHAATTETIESFLLFCHAPPCLDKRN
jgi:hypothetical protein